jgi:hypothetical protein
VSLRNIERRVSHIRTWKTKRQIDDFFEEGEVAVESNNGFLSESSDTNLRHNVATTLHQTGYFQHRTLDIAVDHGTVILEGNLPTWHLRQIALECIRRVTGVVRVVDRIRVVTESQCLDAQCFDATFVNELPDEEPRRTVCGEH